MSEELKSCPFCSGKDLHASSNGVESHFIVCACGVEGAPSASKAGAILEWNRRAAPAAQAVDEEAERPEFEKQLLMHRHDANLRRMEDGHYVGALAYIGFKLWKARAALAAPVQSEQEPFRWYSRVLKGSCAGQIIEVDGPECEQSQRPDLWEKPFPVFLAAPVRAVRLPERKRESCEESDVLVDSHNEGWNACLDEVAQLNVQPAK